MPVSEETYERVALEDPDGKWELVCGRLRQKPIMTSEHNQVQRMLTWLLGQQLHPREYVVDMDATRLRISSGLSYIPDVCVIPTEFVRRIQAQPRTFEVFDDTMPLVVEVWSPSTGDYDVEQKLREYQLRRDHEIWRIHPYERTLTAWRLRPDGSYTETLYTSGAVEPVALPGVAITLADLFE